MTAPNHPAARGAILADDLTGACDAGVHFLQLGCDVTVTLDPHSPPPGNGLAVIATQTRNATPDVAAETVRHAARRLVSSGRHLLYKKMDSTLHGNPGAEIDALLDTGQARSALICPAFPDMGRRYLLGELLLGNERRPTGRGLTARLREQSARRLVHLTVEELRSAAVSPRIRSEVERDSVLVVADAETEADVRRIAELVVELDPLVLPCGSTGLARQLAAVLATAPPLAASLSLGPTALLPSPSGAPHACVGVIGSTSQVTQAQIRFAVTHRQARVLALGDADAPTMEQALRDPRPLLLTLRLDSPDPDRLPALVAILHRLPPAGLLLSGGDTAQLLCAAGGITGIRLDGEIETGVPWGTIMGGTLNGWLVATKAGGFGDASTLVRCSDFFAGRQV